MGTRFEIHLYAADENHAALYFEMAFDEIRRIDHTLSRYQNHSELMRINRVAAREAVTTDPEVFRFLQVAFEYSRRSGGAFDMTISHPVTAEGRVLAVILMMGGIGLFGTFTGYLATWFMQPENTEENSVNLVAELCALRTEIKELRSEIMASHPPTLLGSRFFSVCGT